MLPSWLPLAHASRTSSPPGKLPRRPSPAPIHTNHGAAWQVSPSLPGPAPLAACAPASVLPKRSHPKPRGRLMLPAAFGVCAVYPSVPIRRVSCRQRFPPCLAKNSLPYWKNGRKTSCIFNLFDRNPAMTSLPPSNARRDGRKTLFFRPSRLFPFTLFFFPTTCVIRSDQCTISPLPAPPHRADHLLCAPSFGRIGRETLFPAVQRQEKRNVVIC